MENFNCRSIFKSNKLLVLLLILLLGLFYERDILDKDFNKMLFVIPIIIAGAYFSYENLLCLIALIMPLSFGLSTGYIFPFLIFFLFLKQRKSNPKACLILLFFFLYELVLQWTHPINKKSDSSFMVIYFCILYLTFYLTTIYYNNKTLAKFLTMYCVGVAILIFFIVYHSIVLSGLTDLIADSARLGDSGIEDNVDLYGKIYLRTNANNMALFSASSISILFILLLKKSINKWLAYTLLSISFVGGVASFSRTWVLTIVLYALALISNTCLDAQKRKKYIKYIVLVSVVLTFIIIRFGGFFIQHMMERFTGESVQQAGGRTVIFWEYNHYLINHPSDMLFGVSCQNYLDFCRLPHATHNSIQQIIVCYGLFGGLIFLGYFIRCVANLYAKGNFILLLPIIIVVVFLQTLQIISPINLIIPLIPSIVILNYSKV